MRVTTNTKLIRKRAQYGKYASFGGIAVLAAGMFASFRPNLVWISLVALILGFILAQYGNYNLRRWGRSPRPDQVLEESLKGFDDKYHFYAWSLPAPYVLMTPHGLYTFAVRDQTGHISVKGSEWKTRFTIGKALGMFAQEGMGNPTQDALAQAAKLQDWVKTKMPALPITVRPAIVFIDPRAQLDVTDSDVPVIEPKDLKKWLRGAGKGDFFKTPDYRLLDAALEESAAGQAR